MTESNAPDELARSEADAYHQHTKEALQRAIDSIQELSFSADNDLECAKLDGLSEATHILEVMFDDVSDTPPPAPGTDALLSKSLQADTSLTRLKKAFPPPAQTTTVAEAAKVLFSCDENGRRKEVYDACEAGKCKVYKFDAVLRALSEQQNTSATTAHD